MARSSRKPASRWIELPCTEGQPCRRATWGRRRMSSRLRSFVSLDDDEIGRRNRLSQFDCLLVFGRLPAIERRLIGRKLDHRIAGAARPPGGLEAAPPGQAAGAGIL